MSKPRVTQRHFEATADILRGLRDKHNNSDAIVDDMVEILIRIYSSENPRFKADTFRNDCGVLPNEN